MPSTRQYFFNEKVSLKPNMITKFNDVTFADNGSSIIKSIHCGKRGNTIEKRFHNFDLSPAGKRKIINKIGWLYTLARSKCVKTYSGKQINNFKIGFITLTLPSAQVHPTIEITEKCFNHWLTEIRSKCKIENYLWRLEFQKNGNVHYHIVTDCYIDYFLAQKTWNRIVNKLGYVDEYTRKFEVMSLADYNKSQNPFGLIPFDLIAKRYAKGKKCAWKEPSSVDVKVCTSKASISYYISKYFSKEKDNYSKNNPLDNEDNSFSLRLWFCSRSLSKLDKISGFTASTMVDYYHILKNCEGFVEKIYEYCQVLVFDISKVSHEIKNFLFPVYKEYALAMGYNSA
jgi:hypothetical protein